MVIQKCHGPPKEKDIASLYAQQHAWWSVLRAVENIAMVTFPASCLTLPLCWPPPSAFTLTDQEWDQSHSLCICPSLWCPGFVPFKIFLLISWAFQGVYFDHIHTPPTHHLSFCRNCPISLPPKMLHPLLLYNNPSALIYAVQYSGHRLSTVASYLACSLSRRPYYPTTPTDPIASSFLLSAWFICINHLPD